MGNGVKYELQSCRVPCRRACRGSGASGPRWLREERYRGYHAQTKSHAAHGAPQDCSTGKRHRPDAGLHLICSPREQTVSAFLTKSLTSVPSAGDLPHSVRVQNRPGWLARLPRTILPKIRCLIGGAAGEAGCRCNNRKARVTCPALRRAPRRLSWPAARRGNGSQHPPDGRFLVS